jgi:hypothetical protein
VVALVADINVVESECDVVVVDDAVGDIVAVNTVDKVDVEAYDDSC